MASFQSPRNLSLGAPVVIKDDGSLAPFEAVVTDGSSAHDDAKPAPDLPSFTSVVPEQGPRPTVHPFSADNIATISKHLKLLSDCFPGSLSLPLLIHLPRPPMQWLPNFFLLSHPMRWSALCIIRGHRLHPSVPAIGLTVPTPRLIGLQRSFIVLSAAAVSKITSISFRPVLMASGLMGVSSHWVLGTYTTIPKAPRGGAINRKHSFFLD
jgi:hypothetical protein